MGLGLPTSLLRLERPGEMEFSALFKDWFAQLGKSVAPKTAYLWFTGVSTWLQENEVKMELYSRKLRRPLAKYAGKPERIIKRDIITKDEIVRIFHHSDPRERALITYLPHYMFSVANILKYLSYF